VVWDEAENRLHVQKALMEYLLLGPVGQLCLTHGNDGIEDSLGTVLATFLKRTGDIRVIRAWRPRFRQTKGHRYNHKTPAPFLLEKTVAVAERARVAIEFPHFSRR
jgi:hypothetical protein